MFLISVVSVGLVEKVFLSIWRSKSKKSLFLEYFMEDSIQVATLEKYLVNASIMPLGLLMLMLSSIIVDVTLNEESFKFIILFIPFQVFFKSLFFKKRREI